MFGTRWLATLAGFAFFSHQVGGFLGVWLGGIVFDRTGPTFRYGGSLSCSDCSPRSSTCRSSRSRWRVPPCRPKRVTARPDRESAKWLHLQGDRHRQGRERADGPAYRFRRKGSDGRRRHRRGRMVDGELQGRPCGHRQGAGGAPLPDDRRHRFRRHRGSVLASRPGRRATRSSSTAGASARPISAPMPRRRGSRATGWCGCRRA